MKILLKYKKSRSQHWYCTGPTSWSRSGSESWSGSGSGSRSDSWSRIY